MNHLLGSENKNVFQNKKPGGIKYLHWSGGGEYQKDDDFSVAIKVAFADGKLSVKGFHCQDGCKLIIKEISPEKLDTGTKLKKFNDKQTVTCDPCEVGDKNQQGNDAFNFLYLADQDGKIYRGKFQISEGEEKIIQAYAQDVPPHCFYHYDKEEKRNVPVKKIFARVYKYIFENFQFWNQTAYAKVTSNEICIDKRKHHPEGGDLIQLGYWKNNRYSKFMQAADPDTIEEGMKDGHKYRFLSIYAYDKENGLISLQLAKSIKKAFKHFFSGVWKYDKDTKEYDLLKRGNRKELLDMEYGMTWDFEDGTIEKSNDSMTWFVPKFGIEVFHGTTDFEISHQGEEEIKTYKDLDIAGIWFDRLQAYLNEYLEKNRLRNIGEDPSDQRSEEEKEMDAEYEAGQEQSETNSNGEALDHIVTDPETGEQLDDVPF